MKKNFFKNLAGVLSLAMVVSSVAPATADAAKLKTFKLNRNSLVVYLQHEVYRNQFNLDVAKLADNAVKWSSSKTSVATVSKYGNVVGKKVGTAYVTIKKAGYATKKVKVVVKDQAGSVKIANPPADNTIAMGATHDFNAKVTGKKGGASSDRTKWSVSDTSIATISAGGVVTPVKEGKVDVIATAGKVTDKVTITIGTAIVSAQQATDTKLDVTFNTDMKDAKAADFTIVADDTKQNFAVKSIKVDGKKVTVETFGEINNGKSHTVTYKDSSYKFVATDNKVVSLAITPVTVPEDVETEIKVVTKDANGVELDAYPYKSVSDSKISFDIATTEGYTTGSKLVLFDVGDTAKATATYHTYEYKDGKEVGAITIESNITAVDKTAVTVKDYKYTVSDKAPSNWNTATLNAKLAMNQGGQKVYLYLKNSDDKEVTSGYKLSSSNNDVLVVNDLGDGDSVLSANVVAVAQGSAYILVKNSDDKIILNLPITIVAERKAGSLQLDAYSLDLSKAAGLNDTKTVKATVKDQYGDKMDAKSVVKTVECVGAPSGVTRANVVQGTHYTVSGNAVTFLGNGFLVVGDYQFKITAADHSQVVKVSVKDATTGDYGYKLILSTNKVDANFVNSNTDNQSVKIKVAKTRGGVVSEYVSLTGQDTDNDDILIKKGNDVVSGSTITNNEIDFVVLAKNADSTVTKASAGSYSVKISVPKINVSTGAAEGGTIDLYAGFVIEDTQAGATVSRVKDTTTGKTSFEDAVADAFEFTFDGTKLTRGNIVDVVTIPDETLVNGRTYYIKEVKVNVSIDGYSVPVTVKVGESITIK